MNDTVRPRPALDIHEESNTQEHLILPLAQLFTRWTFIFLLVTFELFLADRHQAGLALAFTILWSRGYLP